MLAHLDVSLVMDLESCKAVEENGALRMSCKLLHSRDGSASKQASKSIKKRAKSKRPDKKRNMRNICAIICRPIWGSKKKPLKMKTEKKRD